MRSPILPPIQAWALILTALLGLFIWTHFDQKEFKLRAEQQQQSVDAQRSSPAREEYEHARTAQVRENESKNELLRAFGGPLSRAIHDPSLGIQQMINQTALACAPTGSTVSVTVDRFTDFNVTIFLPNAASPTQLAEISKRLIKYTLPYIYNVRFARNDKLLAEIDDQDIDSINNWNTVSTTAVEKLILAKAIQGDLPDQPVEVNSDSDKDLTPDQIKINEAERTWKEDILAHTKVLNELTTNLTAAAQLRNIQTAAQYHAQIAYLDHAAVQLTNERKFFQNQPSDLERLLLDKGLNPLLVAITKREADDLSQERSPDFNNLFNALTGYQQEIRKFIVSMDRNRNDWSVDDYSNMVRFRTSEAREAYQQGSNLIKFKAEAVRQAYTTLADSNHEHIP